MTKFKAAILEKQNAPLVIRSISLPPLLDVGQVLVELKYSGICGSQIGEIQGVKGEDKYLPHLLGHEGFGIIEDVGPGITKVKKGDEVVLHWKPGDGIQSKSPKYHAENKIINAGFVTTFNELAIVSENRVTAVTSNLISSEFFPLFGCAITTGLGSVENVAQIEFGDNVLVVGAGGVGLNIIQGCKIRGASKILAVDLYENRLNLAKQIGADFIFQSKGLLDWVDWAKNITDDKIEVIFENTGNTDIIRECYNIIGGLGKVVLIGVPTHDSSIKINTLPIHLGKQILGSHGGNINPSLAIEKYLRLAETGKIDLSKLITEKVSLNRINEAVQGMINGEIKGRVLIDFSKG